MSQPRPDRLPPRGPALARREMLLAFDVGCGELIAGHRFIARGLSASEAYDPTGDGEPVRCFSLEYEFAPGVPALTYPRDFFR